MTAIIQIQNIANYVGQTVTIQGWLYAKTGKGRLQFLQIRDGSGVIQGVMFRPNLSEEVFEAGKRLTQESAIIVTGEVKADERASGIPAGYELDVTDFVRADYAADDGNPMSAFRLQVNEAVFVDDSQSHNYQFIMPGAQSNHPELVLTFVDSVPEPATGITLLLGMIALHIRRGVFVPWA